MNEIYNPPNSKLETKIPHKLIVRPRSVTVIATIFLVLAVIDFIFSVKSGFIYKTHSYNASGTAISSGFKIELLWLILYGVGAGLMRGGKFARVIACIFGIFSLIIPGAIFIYYLYLSPAKEYFNVKSCEKCGDTKYINNGYLFKGIRCKNCSKTLDFKSA